MADFEPVALVDPNGQDYIACSVWALNDLVAAGYTRKNEKGQGPAISAAEKPEAVAPEVAESSDAKPESAERKPVQSGRASK